MSNGKNPACDSASNPSRHHMGGIAKTAGLTPNSFANIVKAEPGYRFGICNPTLSATCCTSYRCDEEVHDDSFTLTCAVISHVHCHVRESRWTRFIAGTPKLSLNRSR